MNIGLAHWENRGYPDLKNYRYPILELQLEVTTPFNWIGNSEIFNNFPIKYYIHAPFIDNDLSEQKERKRLSMLAYYKELIDFAYSIGAKAIVAHLTVNPESGWRSFRSIQDKMFCINDSLHEILAYILERHIIYGKELHFCIENTEPPNILCSTIHQMQFWQNRLQIIYNSLFNLESWKYEGYKPKMIFDINHYFNSKKFYSTMNNEYTKWIIGSKNDSLKDLNLIDVYHYHLSGGIEYSDYYSSHKPLVRGMPILQQFLTILKEYPRPVILEVFDGTPKQKIESIQLLKSFL